MLRSAVCCVANYLFPQGRVVSGDKAVLEDVLAKATTAGALQAKMLAVSGAFHTSRMASAAEALKAVLAEVTFREPRMPVYSNVTGQPFPDAASIPGLLARQLTEAVMWEGSVKAMLAAGKSQLYELGPGVQIKAMVKRIDPNAWTATKNVNP
jgi:[acyl-carrier-protein] S-malonyltransferase